MRIVFSALLILIISWFIRTDLREGTIPMAAFYSDGEETACTENVESDSIPVTVVAGDTVRSLFALYPDEMDLLERLSAYYRLNPHLRKRDPAEGEVILLPLSPKDAECGKEAGDGAGA
ncbi:hypothetical protein [Edaphobacillus lindanitolerans]|uniref:LysM domain-containing protein n=1 Tax=Edaphobacillus lindanitolerans TaxID=550447 RepID=A0A1U7PPY3_9BACI|nr:hypothetical protein [Edaphobacillus lindanitolerans]SIT82115.1 hypothetical protein SAMN05428946_1472 [Edaphobacillus lindanitolerans]